MPETFRTSVITVVDNQSYREDLTSTGTVLVQVSPSIPAAKPGQLTTRTDANTGTLTMESGHGISTGQTIIIFWSGGGRRSIVGTVSGDSVPFDNGSGDDLPANLTEITASITTTVLGLGGSLFAAESPELMGVAVKCLVGAYAGFYDTTTALIHEAFVDAGVGWSWNAASGEANPLNAAAGGAIEEIRFAQADDTAARTITVGTVADL